MSDKKKKYNNCKERGSLGEREEMVLRNNMGRTFDFIDVKKIIKPLIKVGILDSDEIKAIIDNPDYDDLLILAALLDSGPRGFDKFMDALRMAGYNELTDNLEQQLETTDSSSDNSGERGHVLADTLRTVSFALAAGAEVAGVLSAANPVAVVACTALSLGSQICGAASTGCILHSSISNYKGTDSEKAQIFCNILTLGCQGFFGVKTARKLKSSISKLDTAEMAADKQVQAGIQKLSAKKLDTAEMAADKQVQTGIQKLFAKKLGTAEMAADKQVQAIIQKLSAKKLGTAEMAADKQVQAIIQKLLAKINQKGTNMVQML